MSRGRHCTGFGALAAAAALALAACGGSEADPEEFVAEADAICVDAAADAQESFIASLDAPPEDANLTYVEGLVSARESELERLRELEAPEQDAGTYQQYLDLREQAVETLQGAVEAAANDPTALDSAIGEAERLRRRADEIGAELGFEACASRLPAPEQEAVTEVIEKSIDSGNAEEICNELATERFQGLFGGVEKCIEAQSNGPSAEGIEVERLIGVAGVSARATVRLEGRGQNQLDSFEVDLFFEDGTWKLERIESVA